MADKSSQLILAALSRAAAAPDGVPLHGSKSVAGLFPANAAGKQAAQRCQEDGYLAPRSADAPDREEAAGGTATLVKKKASASPLCTITEKGLTYLLAQVSPRQVLEDFVRALETRQKQADELLALARRMQQDFDALKIHADKVLQHTCRSEATPERGGLKILFAHFRNEADPPRRARRPRMLTVACHLRRRTTPFWPS